jgi:hypothetical protein
MAVNPAPMDQCQQKFRCLTGPNQGLAYDKENPCNAGEKFVVEVCDCCPDAEPCFGKGSGTLTSHLSSRAGHKTVTTFYPSIDGAAAGGCSRVLDGVVQVYNGTSFVDVGPAPYDVGDEYLGEIITSAVHTMDVSSQCIDGFFGLMYVVAFCDPNYQSLNFCKVKPIATQGGNFPVSVAPQNNTSCDTNENRVGVHFTYQDGATAYHPLFYSGGFGFGEAIQITSAAIVDIGGCTTGDWDCGTTPACF